MAEAKMKKYLVTFTKEFKGSKPGTVKMTTVIEAENKEDADQQARQEAKKLLTGYTLIIEVEEIEKEEAGKTIMLKEFKGRITSLKQEIIREIRKKELPREISLRCDDPYDIDYPSVEISEIRKTGAFIEESEQVVGFLIWSVETLVCILEEIERE